MVAQAEPWNSSAYATFFNIQTSSASTDADIRIDRRRHPHRPTQTCASTDADIRTDRRRHTHRPTQTYASTDADVRIGRRG
ncbi:hypothetical protein [Leyella stercorea]|uniref:hypothetical protein n=1 Tax=Leyella stercorea TaxID=363265 RepID=UPI00266B58A3|nr:hypothetical protein [Leyella stercorea]